MKSQKFSSFKLSRYKKTNKNKTVSKLLAFLFSTVPKTTEIHAVTSLTGQFFEESSQ